MDKFPRTYIPVLVVPVTQLLWWLFLTMVTTNADVVSIVNGWWPTIWIIAAAFFAGLVAEDIHNPRSYIREKLRYLRRRFEVIWTASVYCENPNRVDLNCQLRFVRDIKEEILTVRIVQPYLTRPDRVSVVYQKKIPSAARDTIENIRLGSIAITKAGDTFARHSLWGPVLGEKDLSNGQVSITPSSKNIVEISLGPQTYRIYADILRDNMIADHHVYLLTEQTFPELQ
jgi:hypothetical protein